jgi:hypothetical protein
MYSLVLLYQQLGLHDKADELTERALALADKLDHPISEILRLGQEFEMDGSSI